MTDTPERVQVLEEAARLTNGDRNADYGPPVVNLEASGELKATMRRHMVRDISSAELEALDMVLTKIGRIITGPKPKRDNYTDGAAYMAIAWEAAKHDMDEFEALGRTLDEYFEPQGSTWRDVVPLRSSSIWPDDEAPRYDDEKPSDT
jgi:hypothetical protein